MNLEELDLSKVFKLAGAVIVLIVVLILGFQTVASVDQDKIMVIQSPLSGALTFYANGGVHWQGFGKVTYYQKRSQLNFLYSRTDKNQKDDSITVRFNDGGHAQVSGAVSWEMPLDTKSLTVLHQKYGSQESIERDLVRRVVEKCIYMTGPLMSSKESYAERRNDLVGLMEDQITNGVYKTQTVETKQADPITGEQKTVNVVKLVDEGGHPARQELSPLAIFGVHTYNLSLNNVIYDDTVEKQIQTQQASIMQVQTAMADARRAEQAAITAAKNGEAEAAKARWEQEVIKARAVTEGQQKLAVAELDNKASQQYKESMIKKGEGEGAYKRAVMQADGALDKKLSAYVEVQKAYAAALASGNVKVVPDVVSGGNGSNANGMTFIDMLGLKAARDLALDVQASGQSQTKK